MRALIVDPTAPGYLTLGTVADPTPQPHQALVRVRAISLNRGELPQFSGAAPGSVPGWDAAGVIEQPAANGKGPGVGTAVVTLGASGAWAELRAVEVENLAVLPDGVETGAASALPVAAGTALRALRACGGVLGRRVLVTGASGGVGRFVVQLAHLGGAYVIAVVGSAARGIGLPELGADEVITDLAAVTAPVYVMLDNVGGPGLVTGFNLLEAGGYLISIGGASLEPSTFPPYATVGSDRHLIGFALFAGGALGPDLAYLAGLLQTGRLDPQIGWRGTWEQAGEAVGALLARQVNGKAVLDLR